MLIKRRTKKVTRKDKNECWVTSKSKNIQETKIGKGKSNLFKTKPLFIEDVA